MGDENTHHSRVTTPHVPEYMLVLNVVNIKVQ